MAHSIIARKCKEKNMEDKRMEEVLAELASTEAKKAALEAELNGLRRKNIGKLSSQVKAEADARLKNRNKQFITAQSARVQAETTMSVRNHIAKAILEESKEGHIETTYCTYALCDAQLNAIVEELTNLGYEVDLQAEDHALIIKW